MSKGICIGIDASRCRSGGARAHLVGVLSHLNPKIYGIEKIHLWAFQKLMVEVPNCSWLVKHSPRELNVGNLFKQLHWQAFQLANELDHNGCDILWTADASTLCRFKPQVVSSRDMLSYEPGVMQLFEWGRERLRLLAILWLQNRAFRHADGVVFLTRYAGKVIQKSCGPLPRVAYVPHGVDSKFKHIVKKISWPNPGERPIRCLYVSNTALYKHQWVVVRAIEMLRNKGIDITLTLVGGGTGKEQKKLQDQIALSDPQGIFVEQKEFLPHAKLPGLLAQVDIYIFASSAEAFGITLLEGMAAGIPIACSNRSCLPELLEDAGVYFDPESHPSIAEAIEELINSTQYRENLASKAKNLSRNYSWSRCSDETLTFITEIAKAKRQ